MGQSLWRKKFQVASNITWSLRFSPQIQMKAVRGVSLSTTQHRLHQEGFHFTKHWKVLYFDRHDQPDVVEYWQKVFIPQMKQHCRRIVEYVVGDVGKEKGKSVRSSSLSWCPMMSLQLRQMMGRR